MNKINEYETLLYTKDENTGLNVTDPFSELNRGLMWHSKLASGSKLLEMNMPLFYDFAETNDHHRYILNQVKLEFAFRRQSALFYTMSSEQNVDFVFDIQECNLHVCNIVVPPQTIVSHTATLAKDKPALYPFKGHF